MRLYGIGRGVAAPSLAGCISGCRVYFGPGITLHSHPVHTVPLPCSMQVCLFSTRRCNARRSAVLALQQCHQAGRSAGAARLQGKSQAENGLFRDQCTVAPHCSRSRLFTAPHLVRARSAYTTGIGVVLSHIKIPRGTVGFGWLVRHI